MAKEINIFVDRNFEANIENVIWTIKYLLLNTNLHRVTFFLSKERFLEKFRLFRENGEKLNESCVANGALKTENKPSGNS